MMTRKTIMIIMGGYKHKKNYLQQMIVKNILTSFTKISVCLLDKKEVPVHVGQHSFSSCTIVDSGQFNNGQTSVPQDMLPSLKKY